MQLRPETPAPVAVANMLAQFAAVIDDNVAGTIAAIDTEFLHDLRVAVRRTRSILKLAGDVLPANLAEQFQPEFKWLGDLTTPVRDLDVYLLELDNMAARLASADPRDLDPFRSFLGSASRCRTPPPGARAAVSALRATDERLAHRAGAGGR